MAKDADGVRNSRTPAAVAEAVELLEELDMCPRFSIVDDQPIYRVSLPLKLIASKEQLESLAVAIRRMRMMADDAEDE